MLRTAVWAGCREKSMATGFSLSFYLSSENWYSTINFSWS